MPTTKVKKKIVIILFIRLNTQSWNYESWILIHENEFAGFQRLYQSFWFSYENSFWAGQNKQQVSWKQFRIRWFKIRCLIWWTSYCSPKPTTNYKIVIYYNAKRFSSSWVWLKKIEIKEVEIHTAKQKFPTCCMKVTFFKINTKNNILFDIIK